VLSENPGSLNLLEALGPIQAYTGTDLPLLLLDKFCLEKKLLQKFIHSQTVIYNGVSNRVRILLLL
jgi:hypothetical protein